MARMDYITTMNKYQNLLEEYVRLARAAHEEAGGPSKKECVYYQFAADKCANICEISNDAVRERYMNYGRELDRKIQELREVLGEKAAPKRSTAKSAPDKKQDSSDSKKDASEEITDEKVAEWFKEDPGYGFEAVAGMEETVKKMRQCIELTRHTTLRKYLRLSNIHSFLLYGPPGCGKTYLARAFAHELMQKDYKFISLVGANMTSMYVGKSAKIIAKVFEVARENAPCIVFIDEFESVCRSRSNPNLPHYATSMTTAFLNGYNDLVERPADEEDKPIIFIGASNYLEDVDPAMIDRMENIHITDLDKPARESALRMRCMDSQDPNCELIQLDDDMSYGYMADKIEGYNRRDINRLMQNVYTSVMQELSMDDDDALEKMVSGEIRLTRKLFDECVRCYNESRIIARGRIDVDEYEDRRKGMLQKPDDDDLPMSEAEVDNEDRIVAATVAAVETRGSAAAPVQDSGAGQQGPDAE